MPEAVDAGVSRAPGRVNLIGDHTDYNGLPVLPIAIRQSVRVEFRARQDGHIRLSAEHAPDSPADFVLSQSIPHAPAGDWRNYAHAAAQAVAALGATVGIEGDVLGDVPLAAGLSSSSALVVAVGHALLAANGIDVPAVRRMELFARAERYVGTEGGGMDQAASIGGLEGHALLIEFGPLNVTPVPIPEDWRFLVVCTGIVAEKSGSTKDEYNRRGRCCREALTEVNAHLGRKNTYRELVSELGAGPLLDAGEAALDGEKLRCFRHTVSEADRVSAAVRALRDANAAVFAEQMTRSHPSLRDDYRVSTAELDLAVNAALDAGALGARLTGAGFGGSVVALTRADRLGRVLDYLSDWLKTSGLPPDASVFPVVASNGAQVTTERTG